MVRHTTSPASVFPYDYSRISFGRSWDSGAEVHGGTTWGLWDAVCSPVDGPSFSDVLDLEVGAAPSVAGERFRAVPIEGYQLGSRVEHRRDPLEVLGVIGLDKPAAARRRRSDRRVDKTGLKQPPFVVAFLWPGIRVVDVQGRERTRRQVVHHKILGVGSHDASVRQLGPR